MKEGYSSKEELQAFAEANGLKLIRVENLRKLPTKARPNSECRDKSAFYEEGRSVTGSFLERLNILPKLESKWNGDGTWRSI
ncbi:MAG: hypothetical protein H7330_04355 [Hymenobacteraceae bacterium]|nr:hypothetical protein [Hymenobacteraceae bacterium]